MKKLLLIISLIISLKSVAQEKQIESFLGIKFGSSKSDVLKAMIARGSLLDTRESEGEIQKYKNVKIGTRKVDIFAVRFVNNKAFQADFFFLPALEAQTIELYNNIVDDINEIYGNGKAYKSFKTPYEDGDGYELTAIKLGKALFKTFWTQKNVITADIIPAMAVHLQYQDSQLVDLAIEKQKEATKSDF